jgi:hypothetical protein
VLMLVGRNVDVGDRLLVLRDAAPEVCYGRVKRPDTPLILPHRPDQIAELLPVSSALCPSRLFWFFAGLQKRGDSGQQPAR